MKDFYLKPRVYAVLVALFTILIGIGTAPFLYFVGVGLNYPLWLMLGLGFAGVFLLYEGLSMLLKPISFSFKEGIFRAGYLVSNFKFKLSDIDRYSTVSYFTKFGIKDGIIIHLKSNRVLEVSGVLINGNISSIKEVLEDHQILRSPVENRILSLTRFQNVTRYRIWQKVYISALT